MRFVQAEHVPFFLRQARFFGDEQSVGGQDDVVRSGFANRLLSFCFSVQRTNVQGRGEALQLPFPVRDDRCRCDYQRRTGMCLVEQEGNGLYGFSQTHVIGQAGTGSPGIQPADP